MAESGRSAVVLVSGGADSTVLLHHVIKTLECSPVHAISFHYGQRHAKELDCARRQAALAGAACHQLVDVSFIGPLLRQGSVLVAGGPPVPDLTDLDERQLAQPPTYVPNRNMMLLSMAAAYAEANDIFDVFYGAQLQDEYGYWDCTEGFVERVNHVLQLNRERPVTVRAPFVAMKKTDLIRLGAGLGVDFSQTWSCYRGEDTACGTCPTCIERLNAFAAAGLEDPLPYASPEPQAE